MLVERGHQVSVVTGVPNYPMGEIFEGYKRGKRRNEVIQGVQVHRCFTIGRKGGAFKRFLNYVSFALSSTMYAGRIKESFDVVLVNQLSPILMACAGIRYARKHHKKLVMYCLDLWPESLAAGGVSRESLLYKVFYRLSANIYRRADRIMITSQSFAGYLHQNLGIDPEKITYLPQYAEALFAPETCHKGKSKTIDLMFAGNIGVAQSVDTIIRAANETKDIPHLFWHIVGEGTELERVKALAQKLKTENVIFHGRQQVTAMPRFYAMADAMLVTMKADAITSMTIPGKVQSYMAAGKPILGAIDGETADVIRKADCGVCVPAGNHHALAQAARAICGAPDWYGDLTRQGDNAARYYTQVFSEESFFRDLERLLS